MKRTSFKRILLNKCQEEFEKENYVQAEIDAIVDELAEKLHAEGKLKELHRELGFLHRFPALFKQCPEIKDLLFRNFGFPRATQRRPLAGKALFDLC